LRKKGSKDKHLTAIVKARGPSPPCGRGDLDAARRSNEEEEVRGRAKREER
jgi:hypothetical protein